MLTVYQEYPYLRANIKIKLEILTSRGKTSPIMFNRRDCQGEGGGVKGKHETTVYIKYFSATVYCNSPLIKGVLGVENGKHSLVELGEEFSQGFF